MKDIVVKIKKIEAEQERRKKLKLYNYNSGEIVHTKQLAFHKCAKKNRWVFGGNRSGKTECGAVEAVWLSRGIHPYRKNKPNTIGWVVSVSQQVQRDVAQQKLLSYIDPSWIIDVVMISGSKGSMANGIIDTITMRNVFGGESKIAFKSCEAGREKFQGASLDFVWFDEEPPQDIYEECKMRVFDRDGDVFGTMTPLKGLTWVYDKIYLNSASDCEVWYEFMEWNDNPYLSKKEIKHLTDTMSEENLQSRRYGRFTSGNGLVYPEFDENIHIIEPFCIPTEWQSGLSIDPGLNNPLSCHWYAVDGDGVIYVIAEHFEAGRSVEYHAEAIKEMCKKLGWQQDKFGKITALIDSAAGQHTLNGTRSVAELFIEQGINVDTRVNKDLFSGINRVKAYLKPVTGATKLYIFKNCVNLIREIKSYYWGNNDSPKKYDDHALDELRYFICSRPEPYRENTEKSWVTLDKERLYRNLKRRRE